MYEMLEQLRYENHLGEEINFGRDGLYVNQNDLHDFSWTTTSVNGVITGFERGMQTRSIPVRIACLSESDGITKRNRLFEIPEKDIIAGQYGRLWINGYYCECFITASKKARYAASDSYMAATLTVTTDRPVWVKETLVEVTKSVSWTPIVSGTGLDIPFDFPFDLCGTVPRTVQRANGAFVESNFRLVAHGACNAVSVTINDHLYEVAASVQTGETLTIDSSLKKIYITDADGGFENVFDKRNRDSYIFEKIAPGTLDVQWNNEYTIDLYLLEERSEPKWRMGEEI